jgi:hypothetical protein
MTAHRIGAAALVVVVAAACKDAPDRAAPDRAAPDRAAPAPTGGDAAVAADPRAAVPHAMARAAAWMAAFPDDELRFDAAIGLAAIRRHAGGDAVDRAWRRAVAIADRDADSPLRRAYDDAHRVSVRAAAGWPVPGPGEARANVNRVVGEALHCADHGLRPETIAYATGPMRDDGGYHTTHAVWALVLARDAGCVDAARFASAVAPLVDELRAAQPPAPGRAVLDVDLFAERLLMLVLAGVRDDAIDGWAAALLGTQAQSGAFGVAAPDDPPYFHYHATLVAAWALVEWAAGTATAD